MVEHRPQYPDLTAPTPIRKNTDETTGQDAGYTPHHQVLARLQRRSQPWLFSVQARYVGYRDRIAEDTRPTADTYHRLSMRSFAATSCRVWKPV